MLLLFEELVQHGAEKDDNDAEVHPEHEENHVCQASVHRGEASVIVDIERVQIGKGNPQKGG